MDPESGVTSLLKLKDLMPGFSDESLESGLLCTIRYVRQNDTQ